MEPIIETKNLRVEFRAQNSDRRRNGRQRPEPEHSRAKSWVFGPNGAGRPPMNVLLASSMHSGAAVLFGVMCASPSPASASATCRADLLLQVLTPRAARFYARIFGIRAPRRRRITTC